MGELFAERVARNVRAEMASRGLSQDAMAGRIGMSQSALSRRLNGDVAFDTAELAALARVLGVDVATLLARPTAGAAA